MIFSFCGRQRIASPCGDAVRDLSCSGIGEDLNVVRYDAVSNDSYRVSL